MTRTHALLKEHAQLLDPAADPTCPLCKEEPQTVEHRLKRSTTDKFEDSGGVWRVLLVQGLHDN